MWKVLLDPVTSVTVQTVSQVITVKLLHAPDSISATNTVVVGSVELGIFVIAWMVLVEPIVKLPHVHLTHVEEMAIAILIRLLELVTPSAPVTMDTVERDVKSHHVQITHVVLMDYANSKNEHETMIFMNAFAIRDIVENIVTNPHVRLIHVYIMENVQLS